MYACFRCRIRKLSCSHNSPTCRQCVLACVECKYDRPKGKRERKRSKTVQAASEDTATEASDIPLYHPGDCLPQNIQDYDWGVVCPSIESANSPGKVRTVKFYEFRFNNDAIVQYLFEPAPLSIIPTSRYSSSVVNSKAEWKRKLCVIVNRMLGGVQLGKPRVSMIKAPLIDNSYAGELLGHADVAWEKCFLAARVVDKRLKKKEKADAGTILRNKVNELSTGRLDQTPTTLDTVKILRLPVAADLSLCDPAYNLRSTPPLEIKEVNLRFSPSPPPVVPLPQDCASQGDGVLVYFMSNNRRPEIARMAAMKSLASDDEKDSVIKQALKTATRPLKKMAPKTGQIGWRKRGLRAGLGRRLRAMLKKEFRRALRKGLEKELRKAFK